MNWPMKVLPAVCVVLLGLFTFRAGSTIRLIAFCAWSAALPLAGNLSLASRTPPRLPISMSAALSPLGGLSPKEASSRGNMRPKFSSRSTKRCASALRMPMKLEAASVMPPAPTAPRNFRRPMPPVPV